MSGPTNRNYFLALKKCFWSGKELCREALATREKAVEDYSANPLVLFLFWESKRLLGIVEKKGKEKKRDFFVFWDFLFAFWKNMAEVLGKSNLLPSGNLNDVVKQQGAISLFPKSCSGFSSQNSFPSLKLKTQVLRSDFHGQRVIFQENRGVPGTGSSSGSIKDQMVGLIGKTQKWWKKAIQPNMKEVTSAQELVDSLLNAGDKLVVVDFFSPGCGGCKALHPKICQLAEHNPEVQFLQVNYEEHKSMCYSLNVHVLPFFRFYRGAHGRLCSFSCTNATIKKFKDALAKHTPDRCSLGPTKGLEEKELLALAANKDLSFSYTPKPVQPVPAPPQEEILVSEAVPSNSAAKPSLPHPSTVLKSKETEGEKTLVAAGR